MNIDLDSLNKVSSNFQTASKEIKGIAQNLHHDFQIIADLFAANTNEELVSLYYNWEEQTLGLSARLQAISRNIDELVSLYQEAEK